MSNRIDNFSSPPVDSKDNYWYGVLNMFPFIFLPLIALIGIVASIVMPYLTGVASK